MKARFAVIIALATVCALQPGCSSKEKEARERERMELEEKSRREADAANKAITDMNRRMFGKKPTEKPADVSPTDQPKPDDKTKPPEPQKK